MIGFILIFWSSKTWRSDRALPIATSVLIGYCDLFGFVFKSSVYKALTSKAQESYLQMFH